MAIQLNHTIVAAHDKEASATFLTQLLSLPAALQLGPFTVVRVGDTSLDYMNIEDYRGPNHEIIPQHYAFLVSESEFDEIFERIREQRLSYWADPGRNASNQINNWDDGRGLYFDDLNGHLLEIITRPYGSGGTAASHPHPLVASVLEPAEHTRSGGRQQG